MDEESKTPAEIPLLQSSSRGSASAFQTLGNIIVSVVGTGVLGLPYAFRVAGWGAGSLGVIIVGLCTYYCMLILVQCRDKLATEELVKEPTTYGDLGYKCLGTPGRCLIEFLIFISQCGGAVAYLVFIGQNLESIFNDHGLTIAEYIFLLVPIEIALSWIGSLSALAPSSIFADVCNVLAMAIVMKEDIQKVMRGGFSFNERKAFTDKIGGLPFAGGMAVFCFEGFGMTLALERSMEKRGAFPRLLAKAFTGITLVYVLFGFCGFMAYGDETKDIITLNLPRSWSAIAVKIGLCLALVFTFPIMVYPVNEIVEDKLKKGHWFQKLHSNDNIALARLAKVGIYLSRAILVVVLATLASFVPGFGIFASLIGSSVCAVTSFVLPAAFHLKLLGPYLHPLLKALDFGILFGGLLFAVYGTYSTVVGV